MKTTAPVWYTIGALVIIVGLTTSVIGVINDFRTLETAFVRFVAPGSSRLDLTKPGLYEIYYEYRSEVNGEIFDTAETTDVKCTIKGRDGRFLEIASAGLTAEYDFGRHAGKAVAQFSVPAPGTYVIDCRHPDGKGERIALAIAPLVAADFFISLLKWLSLAFATIGIGLVILIVTLVRRAVPTRPAPPLA
jgi:hypothetical protein